MLVYGEKNRKKNMNQFVSCSKPAKSFRSWCPCLLTGIMRGFGVGNTAVAASECLETWRVDRLSSHFPGVALLEEPRDPQNIFCFLGGLVFLSHTCFFIKIVAKIQWCNHFQATRIHDTWVGSLSFDAKNLKSHPGRASSFFCALKLMVEIPLWVR